MREREIFIKREQEISLGASLSTVLILVATEYKWLRLPLTYGQPDDRVVTQTTWIAFRSGMLIPVVSDSCMYTGGVNIPMITRYVTQRYLNHK